MLLRVFVAVVVVPLLLCQTSLAIAHARFDHSTPKPGEVVTSGPSRVDVYTVQDMRKSVSDDEITVTGPDGSRTDDGATVVDDSNRRHFSVGLKQGLSPGRYVVSFKTLSDEDGEADRGSFAFYVGTPPTDAQKAEDAKLTLTSKSDDEGMSHSRTGPYIGIAVAALAVLVAGGLGVIWRRRRSAAH